MTVRAEGQHVGGDGLGCAARPIQEQISESSQRQVEYTALRAVDATAWSFHRADLEGIYIYWLDGRGLLGVPFGTADSGSED